MDEIVENVATSMLQSNLPKLDLIVNDLNFGRGETLRKSDNPKSTDQFETINLIVWKIVNDKLELIQNKLVDLSSIHCYVIEWTMKILQENRLESVYFHWKGNNAPKDSSPLPEGVMNVCVQRISQWAEPPLFYRLFHRPLIVHLGPNYGRLYVLRGDTDEEIHCIEVPGKMNSLRSRTCFFCLNDDHMTIWQGSKANDDTKRLARMLYEKCFVANFPKCNIIGETDNDDDVMRIEGTKADYHSLKDSQFNYDFTPRLFYLTDIYGDFISVEIHCSYASEKICPYPFLQSHLYTALPPAIFLLDNKHEIWLWFCEDWDKQTKNPELPKNIAIRFMEKTDRSNLNLRYAYQFNEPKEFINLFPYWIE